MEFFCGLDHEVYFQVSPHFLWLKKEFFSMVSHGPPEGRLAALPPLDLELQPHYLLLRFFRTLTIFLTHTFHICCSFGQDDFCNILCISALSLSSSGMYHSLLSFEKNLFTLGIFLHIETQIHESEAMSILALHTMVCA